MHWITDIKKLSTTQKCGKTLAELQVEQGWRPTDKKIGEIRTLAEKQVEKFTNDKEILILKKFGESVANNKAKRGWTTKEKQILKIPTFNNHTDVKQTITGYNVVNKPHLLAEEEIKINRDLIDYLYGDQQSKTAIQLIKNFKKIDI